MSSAYELQRLANIEQNHAELKRLGLLAPSVTGTVAAWGVAEDAAPRRRRRAGGAGGPAPKKRQRAALLGRGSRRSLRLGASEGQAVGAADNTPVRRPAPVYTPEFAENSDAVWAQALFSRAAGSKSRSSGGPWERRRAHQHLTLSPCARVIATTGCAGYGAALAKSPTAAQQPKALLWKVEVLRLGTGGFAVGVAHAKLPSPFKSLGNNPAAWVVHCDGRTLHNRATLSDDEAGSSFDVGDTISILLAPASKGKGGTRRLSFEKNGGAVGAVCQLPAAAASGGGYTLAVQPYMGGAALLL
jgi:hypothetical protein